MIFGAALALLLVSTASAQGGCNVGSVLTFAKVSGFIPSTARSRSLQLIYSTPTSTAITAECYNRCKQIGNCYGFIVYYAKWACYQVERSATTDATQLLYAPDTSYFIKVCLPVPASCKDKAWAVESTPGYELVGLQYTILPNIADRWRCAAACLDDGQKCASANYRSDTKICTLSSHNKWTDTDSFIPTVSGRTIYLENLCANSNAKKFCWRDPVLNRTWPRSDLQVFDITQQQCQNKCWDEKSLRCVGYSYTERSLYRTSSCGLHTDTKLLLAGPELGPNLQPAINSRYTEIVSCVDMKVTCDQDKMTVVLNSTKFVGRLYVQGRSDVCSVQGFGSDTTELRIPLPNAYSARSRQDDQGETMDKKRTDKKGKQLDANNPCNVNTALAIGEYNRTLITSVVVVQYHQLIQTVSDRVVRVSCLLVIGPDGGQPSFPDTNNVTLNASLNVQEPGAQSEVTGTGGAVNGSLARARMRILDPRTGQPARDIQLGEPLQLRIDIQPPFNVSIVRVGHLVASSGTQEDSLLLLDGRGCPPDVTTFPALTARGDNTLVADFRAFRFPSSPVLMLNTVLTLCTRICQPTDCGNGVISYGKRRRRRWTEEDDRAMTTAGVYQEMPLQIAIIVHSPGNSTLNASNILSSSYGGGITGGDLIGRPVDTDGNYVISDPDGGIKDVCLNFLTLALVVLFWLLLQCVLLALCCGVLARQKRKLTAQRYHHQDTISLRNDFQSPPPMSTPRQHHVTWAPDIQRPDKDLRLSTPVAT